MTNTDMFCVNVSLLLFPCIDRAVLSYANLWLSSEKKNYNASVNTQDTSVPMILKEALVL